MPGYQQSGKNIRVVKGKSVRAATGHQPGLPATQAGAQIPRICTITGNIGTLKPASQIRRFIARRATAASSPYATAARGPDCYGSCSS